MGAPSEWATGLGLCPRAAIAGGAWMWSLPCSPSSGLSLLLVRTLGRGRQGGRGSTRDRLRAGA